MSNKSNRRRENAQSASSSKAAELLQSSGISIPFLGIEALHLGNSTEGSSIAGDDSYSNISPELKIIFKKLTKKDSLTREKAMKELCEHIKPEDELRAIFPFFASNYPKLVTDSTPKIRAYANSLLLTFLKALRNERKAGKCSWGSVETTSLKLSIPFLLFSLNDKCDQVSKSAENLLEECFPGQKRTLMMRTYCKDTMQNLLEIVKLKHKLVQPDQFVQDETDAQRQARLVAQGLETMGQLVRDEYETCKELCDEFFQSPSIVTSLMNSNAVNVRVATLAYLSNLLQKNPSPCFGTKVPSLILNNLDAENTVLSRNAFECFLILAGDKRYYETCKVDKAVVPKLLGVVRKKNVHWSVLQTSLLPAFALVTKILPEADRKKWICSLMDSFFDGCRSLQSVSMISWATPFSELSRYCFANFSDDLQLIAFLLSKVLQFIDVILENSKNDAIVLAQVTPLINSCFTIKTRHDDLVKFKQDLRENLLNKLPNSSKIIENLLDSFDDTIFCAAVIKDARLPNATVVKILQKHPDVTAEVEDLPHILAGRISHESTSQSEIRDLLLILCKYLIQTDTSLNKYLETADPQIYKALMQIPTTYTSSLLTQPEKLRIFSKVYGDLSDSGEESSSEDQSTFIYWTLSQLEDISLSSILDAILKNNEIKTFTLLLLESLFSAGKISKVNEREIALKLFEKLIKNNCAGCSEQIVLRLMSQLEVDLELAKSSIPLYLHPRSVDFARVCNIPAFKFSNASMASFLPSATEFFSVTSMLDENFMTHMLTSDEAYLLSYFVQSSQVVCTEAKLAKDEEIALISYAAKKALFAAKILDTVEQEDGNTEAAECLVWIASTFVAFLQHSALSSEYNACLHQLSSRASPVNMESVFNLFSTSVNHATNIPVCIAFALAKCLSSRAEPVNSAQKLDLLTQFHAHEHSLFATPLLAMSFALNLYSIEEPSSMMPELEEYHSAQPIKEDLDEYHIGLWTFELERTLTAGNMELVLLTLKMFVERKGAADGWLFMYQRNPLKDGLSCVLLRLACKVVPFLAEIDSSIQDFVNCGFITALQSYTDSFPLSCNGSAFLSTFSILCLELHNVYDNCIKLNMDNQDFSDIKQEWREFFGPSSANFIVGWFVDLSRKDGIQMHHPRYMASLCQAIHSIEEHMILKVDLQESDQSPPEPEAPTNYLNNYPPNLKSLLSRAFPLFFHNRPEVQLAAAKIFKSALLDMFQVENDSAPDAGGEEQTLKPQESKHLPKFFTDLLAGQVDISEAEQENEEIQACPSSSSEHGGQPSHPPAIDPLLLGWDVIVRFLAELDVLSRVHYCEALNHKLVAGVMDTLFSCLPDPPTVKNGQIIDDIFMGPKNHHNSTAFNATHFVCHLYYKSLIVMPALVRQWYNSLTKNYANSVNRYTRKYVSHLVLRREIQNVANTKRGRLEVKVMAKVNEVAACYRMEDTQIRLNIALPGDYPLSLATINTERSIVSKELHRKWLLQLEMFLGHQNGSMLEGILQWKRNIDKHLEGIEDCTICMMTVSSTNYQLPKIKCRQCKNKFHGDCLYKWFQTSSNSSCPLCRAPFV